jgi:hypothetical protein
LSLRPRMLAACEMSGRVAVAFAKRGWEAWSADLLPSEAEPHAWLSESWEHDGTYQHYQGDVRDLFDWDHPVNAERKAMRDAGSPGLPLWDLVIAFPPCTHLSSAGARYWKAKQQPRWDQDGNELPSAQAEAAAFFMEMVIAPAPHVAVENPRGIMGRRKDPLFRCPDQVVEPWWFGDPLCKKTCLWLEDLPLLVPDSPVAPAGRVATGGGSYRADIKAGRLMPQLHEDSERRARRGIVRSRTLPNVARAMADQWGPYVEARYRGAAA